jgi:hypothetical protein
MKRTGINDAQLRRLKLDIDDPHEQDGLVPAVPEGVELVEILNIYRSAKYPAVKVRCVKCKGARHRDGFTAELSDGSKILLGSKCGAELFGKTWGAAQDDLNELRDRQWYLLYIDQVAENLPAIRDALHDWAAVAKRFDGSRRRFKKAFASLYEMIGQAVVVDDGGLKLYRERRVITPAGHEERGRDEVVVHRISGPQFFRGTDATQIIEDGLKWLNGFEEAMGAAHRTLSEMKRQARGLSDLRKRSTTPTSFLELQ